MPGLSRIWAVLLVTLATAKEPPQAADLDISATDPAYESLRRIQTRNGILFDGAFPWSATTMPDRLDPLNITAFESVVLLERFPLAGPGLFGWSDSLRGNSFFFSPMALGGYAADMGGDSERGGKLGGIGARIHGRLGGTISYYTHGMVYSEKVDRPSFTHQFDPEYGETYTVEKGAGDSLLDTRTYNRFEYYVKYGRDWWTIKAGRDRIHSGPGYFSSLTATRDTPPYYLVEGRLDFAPWLKMNTYLIKMTDSSFDVRKYANLHRLEFRPLSSLSLAFENIVIYQDREPDPAYLLPLVPLTFSEANSGGRDNAAMSFDALYVSPFGISAWGQLFLDDLLGPGALFDDFWENRWASLAGFQWVMPRAWADADLIVEYSHVEPWTYNGRDSHTSFKHYNVASASKLGPDSRSLDIQAGYRPFPWLRWRERMEVDEKGRGRGATLGVVHDDRIDGQTKSFLENPHSEYRLTHDLTLYYRRYIEVRAWWEQDWRGGTGDRFGLDARAEW